MLECKVFKNEDSRHGASIALMNELHMPHSYCWEMRPRLLTVKAGDYKGVVAVAYKDGAPVSCVVVRLTRDGNSGWDIAAYCKDAYRREGITSQLIAALKAEAVPLPDARTGIHGSHHFWNKNGVACPDMYF